MSLRLVISEVELEDERCEDVASRMRGHLEFYTKKHPEFSFQIIEDTENNKLTVKTVTLEDGCVN